MERKTEDRIRKAENRRQEAGICNLPKLDASGRRYFEPYLSELFTAIGLYNISKAPMFVHSLNAWVCLEPQRKLKGTTDEH